MKKIILIIIYFLAPILSIQAQTLYGTTLTGGNYRVGTINKFIPATGNLTVVKSFESITGYLGYSNFIQASNGKFYGITSGGGSTGGFGSSGSGFIFSFDPVTSIYTTLKDFEYANGANPSGSLIQASDGKLYGMTYDGGNSNNGVIFSFDPSSSIYTKLKDFDYTNGINPFGSLIQASNGKLYGMTYQGGSNGYGVIFSFDPSSSIYTKLKDFDGINGSNPNGSLVQASNGKLYGIASRGGSNSYGVIFSFDPSSSTYTNLKDLDYYYTINPNSHFVQAGDGKLYSVAYNGGSSNNGIIFSFDPSTSNFTVSKDFDGIDGHNPTGNLVLASNGKLYGEAYGGNSDLGVIFSFNPSSSIYTKLKDFDNANGGNPSGNLLLASDGKLYGMTGDAGSNRSIIFFFDPSSSNYTELNDFDNTNGDYPFGSLMQSTDGKLYGMTSMGGSSDRGVIFSFDPSTLTYTKLMDFNDATGYLPEGDLIQASNGKLYGMTTNGGNFNRGVIFSFDPSSSTYTKLKDFDGIINDADGGYPHGTLLQASDGKLYGVTGSGYLIKYAVLFSFNLSTSVYTKLKVFYGDYMGSSIGNLVQASNGKIYGPMLWGGSSTANFIYSFDPSTSIYTQTNIDAANGLGPTGLIQATDGKLYGMTEDGGSNSAGVIFSYDPSTSIYTKLKDFDNTNGGNPFGKLMQASDGKLYGTTTYKGSIGIGYGVIFSFDPSTSIYTKLKDFDNSNGAYPYSAFIEVAGSGPLPVTFLNFNGELKNNQVVLTWSTTNEINNKGYEIERSEDGINFFKIGFVEAKGNTSSISHYSFTDINFNSTVNFYRLKQIDIGGNFEYSRIIRINASKANNYKAVIAPNPFSSVTTISFSLMQSVKVSLKIFDLNGRLVAILANEEMQAGVHEIKWNANNANGKPVPSGVYLLRIEAGNFKDTKKIFVIK